MGRTIICLGGSGNRIIAALTGVHGLMTGDLSQHGRLRVACHHLVHGGGSLQAKKLSLHAQLRAHGRCVWSVTG
jgi:hypothetical protein